MIGIDIEKIDRFKSFSEDNFNRIFTKNEIDYAKSFSESFSHFAGIWCVKEAFIKAIKNKSVPLKKIEVLHKVDGEPFLNIEEELIKELNLDDCEIDISISHSGEYAVGVVEILR